MLDSDTVQIIKRKSQNKGIFYNFGFDQYGLYERVIINRAKNTVSIDRIDGNWFKPQPFLGQRDLFYVENGDRQTKADGTESTSKLTFVRHNLWIHKIYKLNTNFMSNFSAMSYRKAFNAQSI